MDSSTSHSKSRFPRRAAFLLLTAAATWTICIFYTLKLSPETRYSVHGGEIRDQWADKMTREHGAKIVVYGGSSCAFSIDGERLLTRFDLPTVNDGRTAGMGPDILTESVLGHLRPGDTLIMAMEPELLTHPFSPQPEGIQFSFAMHHSEWAWHPVVSPTPVNWFQTLDALRPGGFHTFILLGKIISGRPLFRYRFSDYRPSGWEQTSVRVNITGPFDHDPYPSSDVLKLLQNLRTWCDQHNVRVAYSLPWCYSPPDKAQACQKENIDFLLQINKFLPVLKDDRLGTDTNLDHYADTKWHLTEAGSALRTDSFGEQIKNWDTWSVKELLQRKAQM